MILNSGLPNLKRVYLYLYDMLTDSSTTFQFKYKTVKFLVSERQENNITSLMVEYCISVLLSNFHGPSYSKNNNETYEDYLQVFILTCQLSLSYVPKLKCSCIAENKLLEICKIKICLLTLEQMLLICCYHMALQKIKKKQNNFRFIIV